MLLKKAFLVLLLPTLLRAGTARPSLASEGAEQAAEVITLSVGEELDRFDYIAVDQHGSGGFVYTVETSPGLIGRLDVRTGDWEVLAGDTGRAASRLNRPRGMCVMPHGHLAVADAGNSCVRQVDPATGVVTTLAGACHSTGFADGPAAQALFSTGLKSIVCLANCSVLVLDVANGRLRQIIVHDPACLSAAHQQAASVTIWARLPWLLAGAALACGLQLGWIGARRFGDKRAAAVGQHMERVRSRHTVDGAGAQGGSLRAVFIAAAHRLHLGHLLHSHGPDVAAEAAEAALLAEQEEQQEQHMLSMPGFLNEPELIRLDSSAGPASEASRRDEPPVQALQPEGDMLLHQANPDPPGLPIEQPARELPGGRQTIAAVSPFADLSPLS